MLMFTYSTMERVLYLFIVLLTLTGKNSNIGNVHIPILVIMILFDVPNIDVGNVANPRNIGNVFPILGLWPISISILGTLNNYRYLWIFPHLFPSRVEKGRKFVTFCDACTISSGSLFQVLTEGLQSKRAIRRLH